VWGWFSGTVEGIISRSVRPIFLSVEEGQVSFGLGLGLYSWDGLTCARSCLLLGEAEARMTRLPRIMFRAGRSRGKGGRGPLGAVAFAPLDFSVMGSGLSVYGGGLRGAFSSDMVDVCIVVEL
jgi:hypothetical protein